MRNIWRESRTPAEIDGVPPLDHNRDASRRERIVEHLFVGELLRHAWRTGLMVEVLRPEVDAGGYDLVLECGGVIRHVQLKASVESATTREVTVNLSLGEKPSGCVVWIICDDVNLTQVRYLYFGKEPGEPLGDLPQLPVARHTRANARGVKAERPEVRRVSKGKFQTIETIDDLVRQLFG